MGLDLLETSPMMDLFLKSSFGFPASFESVILAFVVVVVVLTLVVVVVVVVLTIVVVVLLV